MKCPECKQPMSERTFEGRNGTSIAIDVCQACGGLWFDTHESLKLTPAGTLQLFRAVYGQRGPYHPRRSASLACPRCDTKLSLAHDMARGNRFQSSRCPQQHGHFITFFQFLREKGLARELTPREQLALSQHVDTLLCSDCGEPVRLANRDICGRCQAPLSVLDPDCVESTVQGAQPPGDPRQNVAPEVAARLLYKNQGPWKARAAAAAVPLAAAIPLESNAATGSPQAEAIDLIATGGEFLLECLDFFDIFS